ncbi:Transmembrane protein [Sphingomonas antarctica]|uniref:TIGR02186 family protein n=1 Tax=Sphingomonas antarctica TaxID=2040274 RepID=UPI0039EADB5E
MRRLLPAAALLLIGAREPVLVPDVSQRTIDIVTSFSGADLLLFGAILYPQGRVPDERIDVAVVVKGPSQSILVREKQKLAGLIWANAGSARFRSAPSFYAVASSRPLKQIVDAKTAAIYELGLGNLQLSPATAALPEERLRFESGFVDLRRRGEYYTARPGSVEISQDVLYRARVTIPPRVPTGRYTAETFLIRDGKVVAAAERVIEVRKSGFERFVTVAAARQPLLYGLAAVILSIGLGWAAGAVFSRRA